MSILDLFFPRKCLGCGREGSYFCSQCLNFVASSKTEVCPVCERPSIGGMTHASCSSSFTIDGLTSIFEYKGIVKTAITKLKYRFVTDLADDLVELFVSLCGENKTFRSLCLKKNPFLVPIPLHPVREKWRGFNQSALLGKMIADRLGIGFTPGALVRIKNTTPQMKLNEKERKENIKGAFKINSEFIIHNSELIVFDDVWTSGSTLKEAGKILKQNGVKTVWGLTLAR